MTRPVLSALLSRRSAVIAAGALVAFPRATVTAATGVVRPEEFGASGDGRSDDTPALQRCFDAAPRGSTIMLRAGASYRINPNFRPNYENFGGLKLRDSLTLQLNDAELRALPSSYPQGGVLQAWRANNWKIIGPGRIVGERSIHSGAGGEAVHGILVLASSGWTISGNVEVKQCWGDGIYVGSIFQERGTYSQDFDISQVHVWNCRRNGISLVGARKGRIRTSHIHDMNGTSPMAGIDLEPDFPEYPNGSIQIENVRIHDVMFGIAVAAANNDITIAGSDVTAINTGIVIGDNAHRIAIVRNPKIASTRGGEEGAAIRNVSKPMTVRDVVISDNVITGGGIYVIDMRGPGISVVANKIRATNHGVRGAARMLGGGKFTSNDVLITASSGAADALFIQLQDATYGRNIYRNQSAFRMSALATGGRYNGGDKYLSSSLFRSPYSSPK